MSPDPTTFRPSPERYWPGWDAKNAEEYRKKPLYRRSWFVRTVVTSAISAVFFGLIGSVLLVRRQRERAAEYARQQHGLAHFLQSREFASFSRSADAQLLALINFIAAHPVDSRKRLPEVLAWEDTHNAKPWTDTVAPIADAAPADIARLAAPSRALLQILTAHGFVLTDEQRNFARRQALRLLAPYKDSFTASAPENGFSRIWSDVGLQDKFLGTIAARTGLTIAEIEALFYLQGTLGPGAAL